MDAAQNVLLCRLCGTQVLEGKHKNIFDDSENLVEKIKETLPITVTTDDEYSKHICLTCYDQVILHYKFIQDILRHTKRWDSKSHVRPVVDSSKETNDISRIHNDVIYTCPNCNVELMFLLVNNAGGCDYTCQMSLAVADHADKQDASKEEIIDIEKNLSYLSNGNDKKYNGNIRDIPIGIKSEDSIFKTEQELEEIQENANLSLPVLEVPMTVTSVEINNIDESFPVEMQDSNHKRKDTRNESYNGENPLKLPKLEIISYEANANLLNYESIETGQKIESTDNTNTTWAENESEYKNEETDLSQQNNLFDEDDDLKLDENDIKPCPKIICELCGARYLSQLKYEFHMERHRLNKMEKYECTLCEKEASSENLLWDHYYHTHKSLQRYVCTECGKLFAKKSRLNGHQKSHKHLGIKEIHIDTGGSDIDINTEEIQKVIAMEIKGKITVNCNLCGKLISDLDPDAINDLVTCATCEDSTLSLVVDGNEAKVISPRQYHCSKCPKHFVRKERLEFHEMRHNENMNEFVCSTCGKEFSAENSLYEHYLFVHKGARPHVCELCGKSFQLKARLKEHHRTHTGEKPFQCDICGQRCRTTYALKIHRKIHFSSNRYTCNVCSKTFSKKQNMNEHLEKHWKNDKNVSLPQLFTCPICFEDFPTYRMLKYHMVETHKISNDDPILTKQKPWYECPQCHEKFKHQMSLKAHKEKVHEGRVNPVFQCDVCNATFRIKQLLINHIKSKHDGEKRYKCAQCAKGFNDTKSLYNHVLLHTGKKPFVCEFCNMSFRRKDSRDHHRRKHTGEQPYQCPDCNECFSTYNNRSKHRKRVHGDGESECPECGEKCSGQQEVRIHLNKHLGEKLQKLEHLENA